MKTTQSRPQKPDFSSMISVTLDVNILQESLSMALDDIHYRIESLTDRTLIIETNCSEKFGSLDYRMAQLDEQMNFINEEALRKSEKYEIELEQLKRILLDFKKNGEKRMQRKTQKQDGKHSDLRHENDTYFQELDNEEDRSSMIDNSIKKYNTGNYMDSTIKNDNPLKDIETKLDNKYNTIFQDFGDSVYFQIDQVSDIVEKVSDRVQQIEQELKKRMGFEPKVNNTTNNNQQQKKAKRIRNKDITAQSLLKQGDSKQQSDLDYYIQSLKDEIVKEIETKLTPFVLMNSMEQMKTEIWTKIDRLSQLHGSKLQENSKTASIMADHILSLEGKVSELNARESDMQRDCKNIGEKVVSLQNKVSHVKQGVKTVKEGLFELSTKVGRLQLGNGYNSVETQENREDSSGSGGSKRRSILNSINQNSRRESTRTSGLLSQPTSGENLEELIRKMNSKVITLTERLNRMEDAQKNGDGRSSFFPKIQMGAKGSLSPTFDTIRSDLKKLNEQLLKTNQRLETTKSKLSQLSDAHNLLPLQIEDLYTKLREYNEFQQDRLLQLIKEMINRCLTDPFNQNFTNKLKRQINIKFLQIKQEYYGILRQIEHKVEDRASEQDISKLKEALEEGILEVKTLTNKKCDREDTKKGIKYLEGKIKDIYAFVQAESLGNAERHSNKCYVNLKKHY